MFARPDLNYRPKHEGHSEAQLLASGGPMSEKAVELSQSKRKVVFFLWTVNSPCGMNDNKLNNCQKKIFNFAYNNFALDSDDVFPSFHNDHFLYVGFKQWWKKTLTLDEIRQKFCESVTEIKTDNKLPYHLPYSLIPWVDGLAFRKIDEDYGDSTYAAASRPEEEEC